MNEILDFYRKILEMIKDQRIYDKQVKHNRDRRPVSLNDGFWEKIPDVERGTKIITLYLQILPSHYGDETKFWKRPIDRRKGTCRRVGRPDSITPDCVTERMYTEVEMPPVDLDHQNGNDKRTSNSSRGLRTGTKRRLFLCSAVPEFRYVDMVRALRKYVSG